MEVKKEKESKIYKKLVRDKIPNMISENNQISEWYILPETDYENEVILKLQEETGEYLSSKNPEELADMLEVLMELARIAGVPFAEIEAMRKKKIEEKGGFSKRIFLVKVQER